MMAKELRWAYRTIKNGQVKIQGRVYGPDNPPPRDSMEGRRFLFGLYPGYKPAKCDRIAYLWGTEREARDLEGFVSGKVDDHAIYSADNAGYMPWAWWRTPP